MTGLRPAPANRDAARNLWLVSRQSTRRLRLRALRPLAEEAFAAVADEWDVGVIFIGPRAMARLNRQFLGHSGSTDVITFDYGSRARRLHGEIFISVADAVTQAAEFRTGWTDELLRYVVHGALHLAGHDDLSLPLRRRMKSAENRIVRRLRARASSVASVSDPAIPSARSPAKSAPIPSPVGPGARSTRVGRRRRG